MKRIMGLLGVVLATLVPAAAVAANLGVANGAVDVTPPVILLAYAGGTNQVSVLFDEPLDAVSAGSAFNYSLYKGAIFVGVPVSLSLAGSGALAGMKVDLTFPPGILASRDVYKVRVNNVKDLYGNSVLNLNSNPFYAAVQPISWAGEQVADVIVRDSNTAVTVRGFVTAADQFGGGEIHLQDLTGGIQNRDFWIESLIDPLELDDEVLVAGFVRQSNGKARIQNDAATGQYRTVTIELADQTGNVQPRAVTLDQLGEETESLLIRIDDVTIDAGGDATFQADTAYALSDASGPGELFVDANTELVGTPIPAVAFDVIGIGWQIAAAPLAHYQIRPRLAADLIVPLPFYWGDLNGDSIAGTVDASLILQWDAFLIDEFPGYPGIVRPDFPEAANTSGGAPVLGAVDAAQILQLDALLITCFPADADCDGMGPE